MIKQRKRLTGVSGKTRSADILTSPGVDHFLSNDFLTLFIGCSTFYNHISDTQTDLFTSTATKTIQSHCNGPIVYLSVIPLAPSLLQVHGP